jgi:hypothetical protein
MPRMWVWQSPRRSAGAVSRQEHSGPVSLRLGHPFSNVLRIQNLAEDVDLLRYFPNFFLPLRGRQGKLSLFRYARP